MIKYDVDEMKKTVKEAYNDIEEMQSVIEKFKNTSEDFFNNNSDEIYFPKLEDKIEEINEALNDFVIEEIKHVIDYIDKVADTVEFVNEEMRKGISEK